MYTKRTCPFGAGGTIETVEYSDGFGRLLQTRTQAEDVTFGDPVFGGEVLPADQSVHARAMRWVVSARPMTRRTSWSVAGRSTTTKGGSWKSSSRSSPKGLRTPPRQGEQFGQKVTMFYDPRGQVIRTVNPDGSEQRVVFGVPGTIAAPDLTDPDVFEPTPWEAYTYDAND